MMWRRQAMRMAWRLLWVLVFAALLWGWLIVSVVAMNSGTFG